MEKGPTVRNDKRGKWRWYNGNLLTIYSWNTKKEAIHWVRWCHFGKITKEETIADST